MLEWLREYFVLLLCGVVVLVALMHKGPHLKDQMPGGAKRLQLAFAAKAFLVLLPAALLYLFDLLGGPVWSMHYSLAVLAGMIVQWAGQYGGPFRHLLEDLDEAQHRLDQIRVHGAPLDGPNRQTEKVS
jgi:hypothetical protein